LQSGDIWVKKKRSLPEKELEGRMILSQFKKRGVGDEFKQEKGEQLV
jgi:hypothetical protein